MDLILPLEIGAACVTVCGLITWKCAYLLKPGWRLEVKVGSRPALLLDKPNFYLVSPFARVKRIRVEESSMSPAGNQ